MSREGRHCTLRNLKSEAIAHLGKLAIGKLSRVSRELQAGNHLALSRNLTPGNHLVSPENLLCTLGTPKPVSGNPPGNSDREFHSRGFQPRILMLGTVYATREFATRNYFILPENLQLESSPSEIKRHCEVTFH